MSKVRKIFLGAFFSSASKLLHRAIGLVSILILARILAPEDFAYIALVSIILYLFDTLSNVGAEQYIIQKSDVSERDLNSAWSLDIVLKSTFSLCLYLFAPLIADFLDKPILSLAIQLSACILIINAVKNPGLLLLKREFEYKEIFVLSFVQKIISFIVLIILASQWANFWAFIWADIVASLVFTIGSYFTHTHRPKWSLSNAKVQWLFSRWLLAKSVIGYLRSQIDTLVVGKFFSSHQLGNYSMSREVAMLPAHNLLGPGVETLLADFKDFKDEPEALGNRVLKVFTVVICIATPIAAFIATYPALIIKVLLGPQWALAIKLLPTMSMLFYYFVFLIVAENALTAIGKVKEVFVFDLISLITLIMVFALFFNFSHDLNNLLLIRVMTGTCLTLMLIFYLNKYIVVSFFTLLVNLVLVLVCSKLSIIISESVSKTTDSDFINLFTTGFTFCFTYILCLVIFAYTVRNSSMMKLFPFELLKTEIWRKS